VRREWIVEKKCIEAIQIEAKVQKRRLGWKFYDLGF